MTRLDLRAIRAWNLRNARARADYYAKQDRFCRTCGQPTKAATGVCLSCQKGKP